MANPIEIKIVFNDLPRLQGELRSLADKVIRKAAADIKARAQDKAPIDTGFLKNSIYMKTNRESGYAAARAEAMKSNPEATMLPEVEDPGELSAIIAVGAEYGVYVEFGTNKAPARPYLTPATEEVRPALTEAMRRILGRLR